MNTPNDIIIGIDLGTTNSLVAFADESGPGLVPGSGGVDDVILPSVVAFEAAGAVRSVGRAARDHVLEHPRTTVHSIKRLMGKGRADVAAEARNLPYRVENLAGPNDDRDVACVAIGDRLYSAPEVSAVILRELKKRAERHFDRVITKGVITVPAQFDDAQRQATRDAGQIAGLDVLRIVNEPTAAALAYGLDRRRAATIAVYDFGGGTFDISILRLDDGVFEVQATNGDTHLGGDDLDQALITVFTNEILEQTGHDVGSPRIRQELRTLAENAKMRLSEADQATLEIEIGGGTPYRRTISRAEFERIIEPFVERTIAACRRAMRTAGLTATDIDEVVMVGGSTRIPFVRQRVADVFDRTPYTALNPDHVVALGAGVQAAILAGVRQDTVLLDVTPLSLGIETMGGAMGKLIQANVRIPCQASEIFSTFRDGQTSVKINVLQGERELAKDCRSLGVFELRGVPPMPAGIPKIKVTFLIDQNGILCVSAVEERSSRSASVQIVPSHGLTREEVDRMQRVAIEHARSDMEAHHLIDVRTTLEFDMNKAERMLRQYGDLIDCRTRTSLVEMITELRGLVKSCTDPVELNRRREAFNRSVIPLAEKATTAALTKPRP